jgi:phosphoribosylanthranilate isomerase
MFPDKRLILSGGLTPVNVRRAIEETHPAAVDVASGVESSPGVKDLAMVREFIEQAREALGR